MVIKSSRGLNDVSLIHLVKPNSTKFYFLCIEIVWAFPTVMSLLTHKTFLNIKYPIVSSSLLDYQDFIERSSTQATRLAQTTRVIKNSVNCFSFLKYFYEVGHDGKYF